MKRKLEKQENIKTLLAFSAQISQQECDHPQKEIKNSFSEKEYFNDRSSRSDLNTRQFSAALSPSLPPTTF